MKIRWCPGPESNRHELFTRGILSPLRLPVSPPGHEDIYSIYCILIVMTTIDKNDNAIFLTILEAEAGIEPASTALQAAA